MKNSIVSFFSNFFLNITCRDPGSNQGPLDLQSNALPTELTAWEVKDYGVLSSYFSTRYYIIAKC